MGAHGGGGQNKPQTSASWEAGAWRPCAAQPDPRQTWGSAPAVTFPQTLPGADTRAEPPPAASLHSPIFSGHREGGPSPRIPSKQNRTQYFKPVKPRLLSPRHTPCPGPETQRTSPAKPTSTCHQSSLPRAAKPGARHSSDLELCLGQLPPTVGQSNGPTASKRGSPPTYRKPPQHPEVTAQSPAAARAAEPDSSGDGRSLHQQPRPDHAERRLRGP